MPVIEAHELHERANRFAPQAIIALLTCHPSAFGVGAKGIVARCAATRPEPPLFTAVPNK
jgi:hypothetical protein